MDGRPVAWWSYLRCPEVVLLAAYAGNLLGRDGTGTEYAWCTVRVRCCRARTCGDGDTQPNVRQEREPQLADNGDSTSACFLLPRRNKRSLLLYVNVLLCFRWKS